MLIRCNMCESVFQEEQINYDDTNDKEYCPNCGTSGCLMDLKSDTKIRFILNTKKLLESLIGYGEWGDENLPINHDFLTDFIATLSYKISCLESVYDNGEKTFCPELNQHLYDLGDVINFLKELLKQIKEG